MAVPLLGFYEVVTMGQSPQAVELGLAGAEGVVLGVSVNEETQDIWYAVQTPSRGAVMFLENDLTATGRSVPEESIYDGSEVRVSRNGWIVTGGNPLAGTPSAVEQ